MNKTAVVIPAYNEEQRIGLSLLGLELQAKSEYERHIVVVDNGSTDRTLETLELFGHRCGSFVLHIIKEAEKGTGAAADTGFRFAIDEIGADVIARIDADTVPAKDWMQAIEYAFSKKSGVALLTGPVSAGFDNDPTFFEVNLLPWIKKTGKLLKMFQYQTAGLWRFAPGHNMATTAYAYDNVGGFPRADSITCSEDVQYSLAIAHEFGIRAMHHSKNMFVFTSQRRVRELGLLASAKYYISENPTRRQAVTGGASDIR